MAPNQAKRQRVDDYDQAGPYPAFPQNTWVQSQVPIVSDDDMWATISTLDEAWVRTAFFFLVTGRNSQPEIQSRLMECHDTRLRREAEQAFAAQQAQEKAAEQAVVAQKAQEKAAEQALAAQKAQEKAAEQALAAQKAQERAAEQAAAAQKAAEALVERESLQVVDVDDHWRQIYQWLDQEPLQEESSSFARRLGPMVDSRLQMIGDQASSPTASFETRRSCLETLRKIAVAVWNTRDTAVGCILLPHWRKSPLIGYTMLAILKMMSAEERTRMFFWHDWNDRGVEWWWSINNLELFGKQKGREEYPENLFPHMDEVHRLLRNNRLFEVPDHPLDYLNSMIWGITPKGYPEKYIETAVPPIFEETISYRINHDLCMEAYNPKTGKALIPERRPAAARKPIVKRKRTAKYKPTTIEAVPALSTTTNAIQNNPRTMGQTEQHITNSTGASADSQTGTRPGHLAQ